MNQFKHALGSIKVRHNKNTENQHSVIMDDPEFVAIPMSMHIGAPCTPTVKKGDHVKIGQVIGDSDAFLSVPIHASISGDVTEIREVRNMMGATEKQVVIKSDNQHEEWEGIKPPEINDKDSFISAMRASGLVGLGGASFPTFVKFNPKNLDEVHTLIVNGAECEPYITTDYRLMLENTQAIINGALTVMKYLDLKETIIGIESNKPKAISKLNKYISEQGLSDKIKVQTLKSRYPQGAERVLIYETTGILTDAGVLPADVGVIVSNITTIASINYYMKTGMPLVSKTLTVDGTAIKNPQNIRVPIGTSISDVIQATGGFKNEPKKIIMGGPMMGRAVSTVDTPILKANNAILAFSGPEAETQKETACISCGKCHEVCPFHLLPKAYYDCYNRGDIDTLKKLKLMQCMECGSCSYICPARRPLSFVNKLGKNAIKKEASKK
ncbi:MAG: electron transport complex subunit RsxC [Anaerovoracaceae bacterium]|jgi:electron transport complex protein RnfC